jgi:hypothetical protein
MLRALFAEAVAARSSHRRHIQQKQLSYFDAAPMANQPPASCVDYGIEADDDPPAPAHAHGHAALRRLSS